MDVITRCFFCKPQSVIVSTSTTVPLSHVSVTANAVYSAFAAVFTNIPSMRSGIPDENKKYTFSSYPIFMLTKSSPETPYSADSS